MHWIVKWLAYPLQFQSAPDREVGRCMHVGGRTEKNHMFQSAPDREVGRCTARSLIWVLP